jgi:hypothetical protein
MCGCNLVTPRLIGGDRAQQLRQLGDVGGDATGLVAGAQLGRSTSSLDHLVGGVDELLRNGETKRLSGF